MNPKPPESKVLKFGTRKTVLKINPEASFLIPFDWPAALLTVKLSGFYRLGFRSLIIEKSKNLKRIIKISLDGKTGEVIIWREKT